jgi:lipid-A-disaccharide synthase
MRKAQIMIVAGESSGDGLAAELVTALKTELMARAPQSSWENQPLESSLEPDFFGAGGARMKAAGVRVHEDMTQHAVIGLSDVVKKFRDFRRIFHSLLKVAGERTPDVIICVDFSGFNRRFAHAVKQEARKRGGWFSPWDPKIIQFVSPQVWASREGRAWKMAKDYDLLLSIFPFEKAWYAKRVPSFRVEFVGHPMLDRYAALGVEPSRPQSDTLLLLPGSREGELRRHLPVMIEAANLIHVRRPGLRLQMVLPEQRLVDLARTFSLPAELEIQVGDLPSALKRATVALASTGTVTMECAYFGVPTVAFYKTSWSTYQVGKRIVKVRFLAMPNILADEAVFPEFVQDDATGTALAQAVLGILESPSRQEEIRSKLKRIVESLGGPGAVKRAAGLIADLL